MLDLKNYHLLVLNGFAALKREIEEAEQYTAQQYNNVVAQENAKRTEATNQPPVMQESTTQESKPKTEKKGN